MLVLEGGIYSDCPVADSSDDPLFSFIMEETSRSNNNRLSYLPVNVFTEGEGSRARRYGDSNGGPSGLAWLTIHGELAVETSNALISEHRLLFSVVVPIHNEGKFAVERGSFSSCDEVASVHGDEAGMDSHVGIVGENKRTIFNSNTSKHGGILIY